MEADSSDRVLKYGQGGIIIAKNCKNGVLHLTTR